MTTISHEPPAVAQQEQRRPLQLLVSEVWASLAIAVIWLAVMFTSIWGGNIATLGAGGGSSSVPSAVVVAFFAFFATWVVAKYGFRRDRKD